MRNTLLMSVTILALSVSPLLAQTAAPGSDATPGIVQVPDAAPSGSGLGGMRPMRGQRRQASGVRTAGPRRTTAASTRVARSGRRAPASADQDAGLAVPPTGDYRGGVGSPSSTSASNTTAANTRSGIAPRLPDPGAGANTPQAYLAAAQRALAANRTGAAQEALERAETRLLSRSTDPSLANLPDPSAAVQAIGAARRALANRDSASAMSAISAAMSGVGG